LGVTLAPARVQQIADQEVRCIKLRGADIFSHLELAYRTDTLTALEETFLALARKTFRDRPSNDSHLRHTSA
jgi:hypothetical protein